MQASQYTPAPSSSPAIPGYATSPLQQQAAAPSTPQPGSKGAPEVEQVAVLGYN